MKTITFLRTMALAGLMLFALNGWGQYDGTGTFEKISSISELIDGYYVIAEANDEYAMNNNHNGTFLDRTAISPSGGSINNPDISIVWKIEINDEGRTIYNEGIEKYVSYTGSSNNVQIVDNVSTDNQRWSITYGSNVFTFANLAVTSRMLQYNASAPRFACYTSNQRKFNLYKLTEIPVNQVAAPSFNPGTGNYFEPFEVTITSATPDASILYSFDSDDPDEGTWVIYNPEAKPSISETTTIWAYATKDEMDDSNVSSATFNFPVEVANIATLRTGLTDGTLYELTGEVALTFQTTIRNQKYIQDATGAILIDDDIGVITTTYDLYDGISGLIGSLNTNQNMLQFIPIADPGAATNANLEIIPVDVLLEDLDDSYEALLIRVVNTTIDPDGDVNFINEKNYDLTDPTGTGILRTNYSDLNYIDEPIPTIPQNLTGVVHQRFSDTRLVPRGLSDFEDVIIEEPLIFAIPTSLDGFTYLEDNGPSASQSLTVSGLALEPEAGDITITGSENFEVSTDDDTFEAAVQLPYSGGVLSETFVYTRLKAGLDAGTYAGESIVVTGGGAATETVTVNGEVTTPPTTDVPFTTNFEVDDNWDLITSAGSYGEKGYEEGGWYFYSSEAVRETSYTYNGSSYSFRDRVLFTAHNIAAITDMTGFSLQLLDWLGSSTIDRDLNISFDGGETWSTVVTINRSWFQDYQTFQQFVHYFEAAKDFEAEEFQIQIIGGISGSNNGRIVIGQFQALDDEPPLPVVETPTFNPPAGTYYEPQDVEISSATEDATIKYSLVGEEGPWTTYADPIGVATTTTIWAYASKDGMDDSPVSSAVYTFPGVVEVDDIAALRAYAEARSETAYKVTGEVVLTFQSANRNVKYIQDATAAILIDDPGGIIISTYNVYDGVTGITGTLGYYESMLQFTPVLDPGPATSVNNEIVPEEVTLDALTEAYQAKLVKINAVSIAGSGNFAESTNYTITDPSGSGVLRTAYTDLNYIDTPIPEVAQDITGVVLQYQTTLQLVPRSQDDFEDTVFEVDPPQSFTAATFSESRIDLTFESNAANDDVVIVYNATNTFSEPEGTPPAPGQAFAGGTLLYAGTDSPKSHTGLSPQETVYYKAWAYDGANYSPGLTSDATTYASEPSNHVTGFMAVADSHNSITVSWNDTYPASDGYLIKGSTVSPTAIVYPVDGTPEADNGLVKNVSAGVQSHEFTGLAPETEYFFKIFPYNGSGALINYKTDGEVPQANATTEALPTEYLVDFEGEGETKGSYDAGTVNLSGLDWNMTGALIGTLAGDIKNGVRAARLRLSDDVYGTMTMLEDKQNGIGTITLLYSRSNFSGDRTGTSPTFVVEYSIDAGDTWNQAGDETNLADINTLTEFSAVVNVPGDIRIRIRQISGDAAKRWNVDDIFLSDYEGVPSTLSVSGNIAAEDDECYAASESIEVSDFVVESGGAATFVTGPAGYIRFTQGVEVQLNGYLRAWIDPDENYCNQVASMLAITEEEVIEEQLPAIPETASFFKVYPNPVAQSFTLELRETEGSSSIAIEIYSIMGEQLLRKELPQTALYRVDVQSLPRGMYIVRVMQGDKTGVQRIIKQ